MRRPRVLILASVFLLALAALSVPSRHAGVAEATVRRSSSRVARGAKLIHITQSQGPVSIYELRINPRDDVTMDVGLPRATIGSYAPTSSIGQAGGAIAAINGDYSYQGGRPLHAFMRDGDIVQTGVRAAGDGFSVSKDERRTFAGHPAVNISAHVKSSNKDLEIDEWNSGDPGAGQINAYSAAGGTLEQPPGGACSVRLLPAGAMGWGQGGKVARDYTVDKSDCGAGAMSLQDGIVLSADAGGAQAQNMKDIQAGDSVRLTWTMGYPDILDWISGQPEILRGGRIVAPGNCGYICAHQPRSAVGATKNGTVIMVVVDGRRPGYSVGMTLTQLARFMKDEGAIKAVNLDGGGSATMWTRGKGVVNRPSDGAQRPVTNALLLLPHADPGEPSHLRSLHPTAVQPEAVPASPEEAAQAWGSAQTDPGSTGGLLYALSTGQLGNGGGLDPRDPTVRQISNVFARSVGR